MGANREESFANAANMAEHKAVLRMQTLATELGIWLLFCVAVKNDAQKLFNRSLMVDPHGRIIAQYDKIHLFDVDVPGGESHRESDNFDGGSKAILAELPATKLGMTICYDLRFPHLFRKLAKAGAEIIAVPSAFTYKTGEAHWHILLRARAIENSCFIIAPAQCGRHPSGRQTYGHSLIIDPWGKILAEGAEAEEGIITAEIDLEQVGKIRTSLPSLSADRSF